MQHESPFTALLTAPLSHTEHPPLSHNTLLLFSPCLISSQRLPKGLLRAFSDAQSCVLYLSLSLRPPSAASHALAAAAAARKLREYSGGGCSGGGGGGGGGGAQQLRDALGQLLSPEEGHAQLGLLLLLLSCDSVLLMLPEPPS